MCINFKFLINLANLIIKALANNLIPLKSEAFLKYSCNVVTFAHSVEMYSRDTMVNEVFTLHCTPFCTDLINCLLILLDFFYSLSQIYRYIQRECLRKRCQLPV